MPQATHINTQEMGRRWHKQYISTFKKADSNGSPAGKAWIIAVRMKTLCNDSANMTKRFASTLYSTIKCTPYTKKHAWEVEIPMEHAVVLTKSAVFCLHLLMRTCDLTETAM